MDFPRTSTKTMSFNVQWSPYRGKKDALDTINDIAFDVRDLMSKLSGVKEAIKSSKHNLWKHLCHPCQGKIAKMETATTMTFPLQNQKIPLSPANQGLVVKLARALQEKEMPSQEGRDTTELGTYEVDGETVYVCSAKEYLHGREQQMETFSDVDGYRKTTQEMQDQLKHVEDERNDLQTSFSKMKNAYEKLEKKTKQEIDLLKEENATYLEEIPKHNSEIVELRECLKSSEERRGWLENSFTGVNLSYDRLKNEMKKNENTVEKMEISEDLSQSWAQLEEDNKNYRQKLEKLEDELRTAKEEVNAACAARSKTSSDMGKLQDTLNAKTAQLNIEQRSPKANEHQHSQDNIEDLQKQLGCKDDKLQDAESQRSTSTIELLKTEKQTLHGQMEQLKESLAAKSLQTESLSQDVEQLKKDRGWNDGKLEDAMSKLSTNTSTIELLKTERQTMHGQMELLKERLAAKSLQTESLSQDVEQLKKDRDLLEAELKVLRGKLQQAQRPKTKTVVMGLRSERSGMGKAMVEMVTKELVRRLEGPLERENIRLAIKPCKTPAEIPDGPLVVLCLKMSRVGTNIQETLQGIQANKDMIVLVLHNTGKENLSSLTPTKLCLSGSNFRQIGEIFDMPFTSDSGLYTCDLSNTTIEKMATMLKKYSKYD